MAHRFKLFTREDCDSWWSLPFFRRRTKVWKACNCRLTRRKVMRYNRAAYRRGEDNFLTYFDRKWSF